MSNFNLTAGPFMGNDNFSECYIEDIMKHVADGYHVLFTQHPDTKNFHVFLVPGAEAGQFNPKYFSSEEDYKLLWEERAHEIWDDTETKNCAWVTYDTKLIPYRVIYTWADTNNGPFILIWWDHDLGDVVLDSITGEGETPQAPTEFTDYDHITENVYFYYIT